MPWLLWDTETAHCPSPAPLTRIVVKRVPPGMRVLQVKVTVEAMFLEAGAAATFFEATTFLDAWAAGAAWAAEPPVTATRTAASRTTMRPINPRAGARRRAGVRADMGEALLRVMDRSGPGCGVVRSTLPL